MKTHIIDMCKVALEQTELKCKSIKTNSLAIPISETITIGFGFAVLIKLQNRLVPGISHGQYCFHFNLIYIILSFLLLFSVYLANTYRTETPSKKAKAISS